MLAEATILAGQKLASHTDQPSDLEEAKEHANTARHLQWCLDLLEQVSSGKNQTNSDDFEYFELILSVPKTTTQNDAT